MSDGYFHRLNAETPTRLWINNPTHIEAQKALEAGAIACTTNPTYASKMIEHPEMREEVRAIVDECIAEFDDDQRAAEQVQLRLVTNLARAFRDFHERDPRRSGFVSLQSNPHTDEDPARIVADARELMEACPNGIAKIPATRAGFDAIETLLAESTPIIVTEVMTISQAVYAADLYRRVCDAAGTDPPYFVTHITGIFDEYIGAWSQANQTGLDPLLIKQAGTIVGRTLYAIYQDRSYPGVLLGGGARERRHFTEFVGGAMDITINWKGMAEDLIDADPPVEHRIGVRSSEEDIRRLAERIPAFRIAMEEDAQEVEEFDSYGPVELFRSMFVQGWDRLVAAVSERRKARH